MNWDDLRFFLAVARFGTLTIAASYLKVDHATVGRRITSLEESMSVKLFDRSPKGYVLREAGELLLPFAERLESDMMAATDLLTDSHGQISGTVKIGAQESVAAYLLAEGAHELCIQHPELKLQLLALPQSFSLSKREADFVITTARPTAGRLKIRKISNFKLHIYATKKYLRSVRSIKSKKDLLRVRGIGYIPDLISTKELDYIPNVDPSLRAHLTSTSIYVQLKLLLNNSGLCILPDFIACNYSNLKMVLPDKVELERSFYLVIHEDISRLKRIRVVADFLTDTILQRLNSLETG